MLAGPEQSLRVYPLRGGPQLRGGGYPILRSGGAAMAPPRGRCVMHKDLDAFYCAVEAERDPGRFLLSDGAMFSSTRESIHP